MPPPAEPKIYHIVHVDRLASIVAAGCLWSDAEVQHRAPPGTIIGHPEIKQRRLTNPVKCRPGLNVGDCVPFYFCPRSVMLFPIYKRNHPALAYRGGQGSIVHLEADLHETVDWAEQGGRRWAFTLTNAGSRFFADRCDLAQLDEIDWGAVRTNHWVECRDEKQAEFLVERSFPWTLVRRIGVCTAESYNGALNAMQSANHQPAVTVQPGWYY